MDSTILLVLRIGLLVLLWLFILFALNVQRRDVKAAGTAPVKGTAPVLPAAKMSGTPRLMAIVDGPMTGSQMELAGYSDIVIGRAQDCAFVVSDDFASSRHARLFQRGSDWFVEDLDSRNGTFVDGARIEQPEKVQTGSDIKIGRTTVRLVP